MHIHHSASQQLFQIEIHHFASQQPQAWLVNKEGRDVESLKQSAEYKMEFSLKLIGWASMLVIMQTDFIR